MLQDSNLIWYFTNICKTNNNSKLNNKKIYYMYLF